MSDTFSVKMLKISYTIYQPYRSGALKISSQDGVCWQYIFFTGFLQRWKRQHASMPRSATIRQSEPPSIMEVTLLQRNVHLFYSRHNFSLKRQIFVPLLLNSIRHQRSDLHFYFTYLRHAFRCHSCSINYSVHLFDVISAPARKIVVCASLEFPARTKWGKFDRNGVRRNSPGIYFCRNLLLFPQWTATKIAIHSLT